jgi:copper chaperone PCu(A)C
VNRALRAATMGVLLLSPVALTACSAGQVAQTATQNRDKVGPEAAVGDISLRQITLAHPTDGLYEEGESAELQLAIVNGDTESDTLVGIEGEAFDGVVVSGEAAAVPTTPGAAPVATTPATPTTPGAAPQTTAPGTTPTPGTVPTPSVPAAPATPTASSEVDIPIPAGSTVFLGGAGGATVELADLTEELTAGQSIEVTLTFERAGEVTVQALVATPERVVPREEPFDFHHEEGEEGAEGGAEDIAREGESEAGSGPGEHE